MKKINGSFILFAAISLFFVQSCSKGDIPTLTTAQVTNIMANSARSGGTITDDGGSEITSRGVCINTSGNPTIADMRTLDGSGTGSFISVIKQLIPGTYYTIRAYATNRAGTGYGNELSFATPAIEYGSMNDIEGNTYVTVTIGTQTWMAENLKTTKYNDGTDIPNVTGDNEWKNLNTPGYCWYNNDASTYKSVYGALYNWYAVATGKLCPSGWHVPTDDQWIELARYLGGEAIAGNSMKEVGNSHWKNFNEASTNTSGFTALPGGGRIDGTFSAIERSGAWWTSTPYDSGNAYCWELDDIVTEVLSGYLPKSQGFSIRCIKSY